jgi:hypothetical protein
MVTLQSIIDEDPDMVTAFVRGSVMAMVFAEASPECTVKVFWENWPAAKPTGDDEALLLKNDVAFLKEQMAENEAGYKLYNSQYWGMLAAPEFENLQDFALNAKLIETKVDPTSLVVGIPDFFKTVNTFDVAAVQNLAKSCPAK